MKKSLGQHFLMHQATADRIADAAGIKPNDTVLEIGPGGGILTRALLARAKKVIAVETDTELLPGLQDEFAQELENGRLVLISSDIRVFDPTIIDGPYALVANIPYYITGEIFRMFLEAAHQPSSMTLLVQKEVAVRIAREKKESVLSLSVKAYGTPRYCFTVPKGAFRPAPSVDSAVLTMSDISRANFANKGQERLFFDLVHAGFAHKRKLLAKNLETVASPAALARAFATAHLPPKARAEDVPLHTWLSLVSTLSQPAA